MRQDFVLGFAFNSDRTHVLLIEKNRPDWQAGKLNGIGGKIEHGETAPEAMVRECAEECNVKTQASDWHHFLNINGPNYTVFVYRLFDDAVLNAETMTDETVLLHDVALDILRDKGLSNVSWMIGIALDAKQPDFFIEAAYAA